MGQYLLEAAVSNLRNKLSSLGKYTNCSLQQKITSPLSILKALMLFLEKHKNLNKTSDFFFCFSFPFLFLSLLLLGCSIAIFM